MRPRSLARQLIFGAVVALLLIAAVPVVYVATLDGIDAVRAGDAGAALERGLVAVVAAVVPVLAVAAYGHWLYVTSRPHQRHDPHVPTVAEDLLVTTAVIMVVVAALPIVSISYGESSDAFAATDLAPGVGYALIGGVYVAFTAFCVKRFVDWMR